MGSSIELKTQGTGLKVLACAVVLFIMAASAAKCQTWSEWWSQKKTQKKYLLEQIAALQVYTGYLKKGYEIAGTGLGTVKDIKNGEFGLHSTFFSSLKAVSPAIRNNAKVAGIIAFQIAISKAFNGIRNNGMLSLSNQQYITDVRERVIDECAEDLEELLLIITSGEIEMTGDERIERLDKVYEAMKDKSAFTQSFMGDVGLLIRQKENEQESVNRLRRYYESN